MSTLAGSSGSAIPRWNRSRQGSRHFLVIRRWPIAQRSWKDKASLAGPFSSCLETLFTRLHAGIKRIGSAELSLVHINLILMSVAGWICTPSVHPAVSAQTAQQVSAR